jgi:sugar-specific transcriptional regulator TrmB/DNA-binding CsgD family transcriptional regulator
VLEAIGLSAEESRLYTTLIDHPHSTAGEIAEHCGLAPRLAARSLAQFVRRGLASRLPGKRVRYVAVAPDVSIQPLLTRREDELHRVRTALHELTTAFHRAARYTHPAELVEVVTGAENVASRAFQLQDGAKAMMRAFNKPPYVMPTHGNASREARRLREGIEYRAIYDRESLALPGALDDIHFSTERGEKARVRAELPIKLWIADEEAAIIPMRGATYGLDAAFVVHASSLLDALVALFETEWRRATPIRPHQYRATDGDGGGPDETTRAVLALLAGGVTDESIARALNLSLRTVQRRIHDVMDELDVTTRFQAGMAAKERGWV